MYKKVLGKQVAILKALAHPKRLEIVALLAQQELSVSAIYSMLDLPQANSSQHLAVLRHAELLTVRKVGKECMYGLTNESVYQLYLLARSMSAETFVQDDMSVQAVDPVCGMSVSVATALFTKTHQETEYYFCASGCLHNFSKEPAKYVSK